MATLSDAFPSKYLKCADLNGRELAGNISLVTFEMFDNDGRKQKKAVVHFSNDVKPLVCNKTNWMLIETVTGQKDSDHWVGKTITLVPDVTTFQGRAVETIWVRRAPQPIELGRPPAPIPQPAVSASEELNDSILI